MPEAQRDEIAKLEALYAANPEGHVFTHLAEAYRKAGELAHARDILAEGLRRHPDSASAHVVLGRVEHDRADDEAARRAFTRVLELDSGNLIAIRFLGDLALERGDRAEAMDRFRELQSRGVSDPALEQALEELGHAEAPAAAALATAGEGELAGAAPEYAPAGDTPAQPDGGEMPGEDQPAADGAAPGAADGVSEPPAAAAPEAAAQAAEAAPSPLSEDLVTEPETPSPEEPAASVEAERFPEPAEPFAEEVETEAEILGEADIEFLGLDTDSPGPELEFLRLEQEEAAEAPGEYLVLEPETPGLESGLPADWLGGAADLAEPVGPTEGEPAELPLLEAWNTPEDRESDEQFEPFETPAAEPPWLSAPFAEETGAEGVAEAPPPPDAFAEAGFGEQPVIESAFEPATVEQEPASAEPAPEAAWAESGEELAPAEPAPEAAAVEKGQEQPSAEPAPVEEAGRPMQAEQPASEPGWEPAPVDQAPEMATLEAEPGLEPPAAEESTAEAPLESEPAFERAAEEPTAEAAPEAEPAIEPPVAEEPTAEAPPEAEPAPEPAMAGQVPTEPVLEPGAPEPIPIEVALEPPLPEDTAERAGEPVTPEPVPEQPAGEQVPPETPVQVAAEAELVLAQAFEAPAEPIPVLEELVPLGDLAPLAGALPAMPEPAAGLFTETMAELYRRQGFAGRAADVYRALLARDPENARLQELLAEVEADLYSAPTEAGPAERQWLHDADSVESAFTGAGGAVPAGDSPYSWSEAGKEPGLAGPTIGVYFRELLAWRPAVRTGAGSPELLLEEVIPDGQPAAPAGAPAAGEAETAPQDLMPWEVAEPVLPAEDTAAAGALELGEAAPVVPEPTSAATLPLEDLGPAAAGEGEGEDEDLEMFRSWLQSLKK